MTTITAEAPPASVPEAAVSTFRKWTNNIASFLAPAVVPAAAAVAAGGAAYAAAQYGVGADAANAAAGYLPNAVSSALKDNINVAAPLAAATAAAGGAALLQKLVARKSQETVNELNRSAAVTDQLVQASGTQIAASPVVASELASATAAAQNFTSEAQQAIQAMAQNPTATNTKMATDATARAIASQEIAVQKAAQVVEDIRSKSNASQEYYDDGAGGEYFQGELFEKPRSERKYPARRSASPSGRRSTSYKSPSPKKKSKTPSPRKKSPTSRSGGRGRSAGKAPALSWSYPSPGSTAKSPSRGSPKRGGGRGKGRARAA